MPTRVIIDADPGVDDTAAILLALASPELEIEAVTAIYGNGSMAQCAANARRILAVAGRSDIPVYPGAAGPLLRIHTADWAAHIHGDDALGGEGARIDSADTVDAPVGNRAAVEIARRVLESPGDITVLALGRMTNLALALRIAPEIAVALAVCGDPESAAVLYDSGVPIVQVGLDVCDRCGFSDSQLHQLSQSEAPAVQLLVRATGFIQQAYRRMGRFAQGEAARYNDVPAVAYAVDSGLMQTTLLPVSIDTASDLTRGQTVVDWHGVTGRAPNVDVCLEVDAARLTEMVVERLINHDWPIH
ncbi:Pyrimidine-specific ribonucleoside hydrolase RihA [Geodia barretti]|uniref:Pyrimidine-specific ribonucleoside hydrolase RihA n=1 Tax=Geodia barretti TaxID=519541 RepID=A0AA35X3S3_GEOBA|nr:Pyrimidine-specific ribonucleoside hydrolase RihA [Geodia barretti]